MSDKKKTDTADLSSAKWPGSWIKTDARISSEIQVSFYPGRGWGIRSCFGEPDEYFQTPGDLGLYIARLLSDRCLSCGEKRRQIERGSYCSDCGDSASAEESHLEEARELELESRS